jgi:hypothetical protein
MGTIQNLKILGNRIETKWPETIQIELTTKHKNEIDKFFSERSEILETKDCKKIAKLETSYVLADEIIQKQWLNDCQNTVNTIRSSDYVTYR